MTGIAPHAQRHFFVQTELHYQWLHTIEFIVCDSYISQPEHDREGGGGLLLKATIMARMRGRLQCCHVLSHHLSVRVRGPIHCSSALLFRVGLPASGQWGHTEKMYPECDHDLNNVVVTRHTFILACPPCDTRRVDVSYVRIAEV